ncbi:MAG: hypothetical protein ACRC41_10265 [Sarcina sp.]
MEFLQIKSKLEQLKDYTVKVVKEEFEVYNKENKLIYKAFIINNKLSIRTVEFSDIVDILDIDFDEAILPVTQYIDYVTTNKANLEFKRSLFVIVHKGITVDIQYYRARIKVYVFGKDMKTEEIVMPVNDFKIEEFLKRI